MTCLAWFWCISPFSLAHRTMQKHAGSAGIWRGNCFFVRRIFHHRGSRPITDAVLFRCKTSRLSANDRSFSICSSADYAKWRTSMKNINFAQQIKDFTPEKRLYTAKFCTRNVRDHFGERNRAFTIALAKWVCASVRLKHWIIPLNINETYISKVILCYYN